jgi:phosphate starvation-inducible PhoH-like protein
MTRKKTSNTINCSSNEDGEVGRSKTTMRLRPDSLKKIEPLTENQKKFFDAYDRGDYFIMLSGSAGTGKSYIAVYKSIQELLDRTNTFRKLVIVRSAVQSRDVGFTPGSIDEKMSLYEQPYIQICESLFNRKESYDILKESGKIEFISTSFVRGCTFDDSIIIVDEMQNCNWEELSTIMTRVGYQSKIIFCGDYKQSDLYRKQNDRSGLLKFHAIAKTMESFTSVEFTTADIVRSSLVKDFLIAVEKYESTGE